jgi:hypothetical protein
VRRPPIGTPFHPAEMKRGKIAFNLFPKAFHIPVTAEYHNNKIRIYLQPATSDLNDVARVTYVFLTSLTLLIPAITTTECPYKERISSWAARPMTVRSNCQSPTLMASCLSLPPR